MPEERRYRDDEIASIFEAAAATSVQRAAEPQAPPAEGMTLAELQAIGGEVGLAPERIAEAAVALDLRRETLRRSSLGMPVTVGRTVELPRAPTDREWAMIVADLRQTFNARGREGGQGNLREWTNGNLHAYVEPTATGYRLRMGTTKGDAAPLNRLAATSLAMAVLTFVVLFLAGELPGDFGISLIFAVLGAATLGFNALRLPAWARNREEQMEAVSARAVVLLGAAPERAAGEIGPVGEG
jgi:hypothetical protein